MPLEVLANTDDGIRGASSIMCLSEMDACEEAAVETTRWGKSAEIGGRTARPKKQEIAQTSNTEPQVRTITVALHYVWLSTSVY